MAGEWIEYLDRLVWGWPMITLLMGTHLYLTVRTGGIQRQVFRGIRLSVSRDPDAAEKAALAHVQNARARMQSMMEG